MITVFLVLSLSEHVVKLLTRPLLENTCPHGKEKILADVTYAQHTVVHHLDRDISLLMLPLSLMMTYQTFQNELN